MSKIKYNKHFCAFIDILGYKNMIDEVEKGNLNAHEAIMHLEHIIKSCIDEHINHFNTLTRDSKDNIDFDYIIFSDSVIISTPILNQDSEYLSDEYINKNYYRAWFFLLLLMDIQMLALEYNILFRGAVSIGNHYRSDRVMFSKALIKAYEAESNKAIYPRIIIDQGNNNDVLEVYSFINGLVNDGLVIRDGKELFIDYIGRVNSMRGMNSDYTSRKLLSHKKIIEENLIKFKSNKLNFPRSNFQTKLE